MTSPLAVHVSTMTGDVISLEMAIESTVDDVRTAMCSQLEVSPHALLFYVNTGVVPYAAKLDQFDPGDDGSIQMSMIEVDPMWDLGTFDSACHKGISVTIVEGPQGDHSILKKTVSCPDSNNVLLLGKVHRPCFVEFEVLNTCDEMSFGVTYDAEEVQSVSGFSNLRLKTTWLMSKKKSMPVLMFGGERPNPPSEFKHGFANNDRIMVIADPEERRVRFFRNDCLVADNLPNYPLPDFDPDKALLRFYCMVDGVGDEIKVLRWGPAESLSAYGQAAIAGM